MSGGVDSSVSAYLLKQQGYDVIGITMLIYDDSAGIQEYGRHACYGPGEKEDLLSAASLCRDLGIPFHSFDLKEEYRREVLDYVREEYLAGRTPNPCVVCNRQVKFGFLTQKAKEAGLDFDFFATGHYARIEREGGRFLLKRAVDRAKDQSYFLYGMKPNQLGMTLFPLGGHTKEEARRIARSIGLKAADRPESQDFVAGGEYATLFSRDDLKGGDIVDVSGNVVGRHRGIIHYTVGQRRGLGVAAGRPLYVVKIDAVRNRLVVGDRDRLFSRGLIAGDLNLIALDRIEEPLSAQVKIRLQHRPAKARIFPQGHHRAKVLFDEPQMTVTPGQSAVFYSGDVVLGGGVIEKAL